jgi:alpha-galactosidase
VLANLDLLSDRYKHLELELVQVDDGYQTEVGDWLEANDKFPGGMKDLADEIKARGKVPGIWVAPFTVTRRSRVFQERKDWLFKGRWGRPSVAGVSPDWKRRFYGLDLTHPEVLAYINEVFSTLAGYGYRFFKLDFMATGLLEGKRYDPSLTSAEAARRALAKIREAVGEESVLMAAGGPVLLGTGIVDRQRVGPDVAPTWRTLSQYLLRDRATPGLRNCLVNTFTRCFLNGRLFEADPDCLLLRGSDRMLDSNEIKTLASGIGVFGGAMLFSDDLGLWGPEQESIAARLAPHVSARPKCPDLWRSEVPRYMVSALEDPSGQYYLLWVINWAGAELSFEVRLEELGIGPGRWHACEFWSERYLGETDDSFSLGRLPPHGSAVVRLTPASDEPRLIGSNIHVSQGAAELRSFEAARDGLSMAFVSPVETRAVVSLSLPGAGGLSARGGAGASGITITRLSTPVYQLEFELDRSRRINLEW